MMPQARKARPKGAQSALPMGGRKRSVALELSRAEARRSQLPHAPKPRKPVTKSVAAKSSRQGAAQSCLSLMLEMTPLGLMLRHQMLMARVWHEALRRWQ